MDKPSIDKLLDQCTGMYELAAIAGRRAIEIKRGNREIKQPLQQALNEIVQGNIDFAYKETEISSSSGGDQIELPLGLAVDPVKLDSPRVRESVQLEAVDSDDSDDDEDEHASDDEEEVDPEVDVLDDDFGQKLYDDGLELDDE